MLLKDIILIIFPDIGYRLFRHDVLRGSIILRDNTEALKASDTAFIQSFPTDLPESWKPFSILHVFAPPFPSQIEGLFAWERPRNCGRFSWFSSRPFIREPRRSSLSPRRHRSGFCNPLRFLRKIPLLRFSYSLCRQISSS